MNKTLLLISKIIISVFLLNLFAGVINYVTKNKGSKLGFLTSYVRDFAEFPSSTFKVIQEIRKPERLNKIDPHFKEVNNISYDVFALNASYIKGQWITRLTNLKDDSAILEWILKEEDYTRTNREFSHAEPLESVILKDSSLVLNNTYSYNLFRLKPTSEVLWENHDLKFHHSINLDHTGNIWACTMDFKEYPLLGEKLNNDCITKVDVESGGILFHKSIIEIFIDNDLSHIIFGYTNGGGFETNKVLDPIHLNDIEPALFDGPFWKTGDLFLSLRHRAMIVLYRPSTNKIIRIIQGGFYGQHDVDILTDSTISIFNNNAYIPNILDSNNKKIDLSEFFPNADINNRSKVVVYNFEDSTFTSLYSNQFETNEIFTMTQGLHHLLSNGDLFVEEQNDGKIFIFNNNEVLLRKYINKPENGLTEHPHWVRIYEDLEFLR